MGVVHEDKVALNDGRVLFRRSIPLAEGSQVSRVWSFRDITAEERSKAELQASRDEAQRANAAKSEFLSRMSHELRTPLHAIMGMTAMARRRMADAKGIEHLDKAKAAADHLLSVINDILDPPRSTPAASCSSAANSASGGGSSRGSVLPYAEHANLRLASKAQATA